MDAAAARDNGDGRQARPTGERAGGSVRRAPQRPATPPPAATTTETETETVWVARLAHGRHAPHGRARHQRGRTEHSLVLVNSDRFPHGTPVDLAALDARGKRPAGWLVDVRYRACDGTVLRAEVSRASTGPGGPLWFAEIAHATSEVPSSSLLAFAGAAYPPGTLVGPHEVARRGLRMNDRVGELRWWTRSGVVDTVQVEPAFRRHGIGRVLVVVAEGLCAVRGWAPLTGDGRVTDSGADWLAGAPAYWRPRLAERTTRLPDDERDGLSGVARLLQ